MIQHARFAIAERSRASVAEAKDPILRPTYEHRHQDFFPGRKPKQGLVTR